MSAVIFLRHAKSDWHAGASNDIERPLNKRGRQAAAAVGIFLAESGHVPDLVLCSPATRTRETLELAMEAGGWTSPTEFADELYYGSVNHMIALACQQRAPVTMLVGHEPTTSTAIGRLTGADVRMPTAALAYVTLNPDNTGQLDWLFPPRLLTDR